MTLALEGGARLDARWVVEASARPRCSPSAPASTGAFALHVAEARWTGVLPWEATGLPRARGARGARSPSTCSSGAAGARLTPLADGAHALAVGVDPAQAPAEDERCDGLRDLVGYGAFVRSRPGLRELLRGAEVAPESLRVRTVEPGYAKPSCGPGWFAVGEAAGELDPFDDAPLRQLVETVRGATRILVGDLSGKRPAPELDLVERDELFRQEFRQRAQRLGAGAYLIWGDPLCCAASVHLDRAFEALGAPAWLHPWRTRLRARLVRVAERRLATGRYGLPAAPPVGLAASGWPAQLVAGLAAGGRVEWDGFREALTPVHHDTHEPVLGELLRRTPGGPR
ncbi:MAG: hypothetical protein H6828_10110 [Planctomycetes bacterium]|nr:hypothetical protein [Planctomycetota bacterium]